jgi:polar amino acid transport system substrate-binding protein
MRTTRLATSVAALALVVGACGAAATPTPQPTPTPGPVGPCDIGHTLVPGFLTIGADNPAFPPYFQPDEADSEWEFGYPYNGLGFEAAVAYAVADQMGYAEDDVNWIVVPFTSSFAPGAKEFDLYLSQVSYSDERAQAVDLSESYFDVRQTILALAANPIAAVTTVEGLKAFGLGAPVGTTSYSYIVDQIQPETEPSVYDTLDASVQGLVAGQIDGIVVDLPTAFYLRDAELDEAVIVGQLPTVGEESEHFSIVLARDQPFTECVNDALAALRDDGTLAAITEEWITGQGAPELD